MKRLTDPADYKPSRRSYLTHETARHFAADFGSVTIDFWCYADQYVEVRARIFRDNGIPVVYQIEPSDLISNVKVLCYPDDSTHDNEINKGVSEIIGLLDGEFAACHHCGHKVLKEEIAVGK